MLQDSQLHATRVYCEPNQLKQVFINFQKNGIEAMARGGTLTPENGEI